MSWLSVFENHVLCIKYLDSVFLLSKWLSFICEKVLVIVLKMNLLFLKWIDSFCLVSCFLKVLSLHQGVWLSLIQLINLSLLPKINLFILFSIFSFYNCFNCFFKVCYKMFLIKGEFILTWKQRWENKFYNKDWGVFHSISKCS